MESYQKILVIAGSDSSGGAGLEADQRVIATHGCYAMTATTALTIQDTNGVHGIHVTPPQFVQKQIDTVADDIGISVVKTGMLACRETVQVVAGCFKKHCVKQSVVDPVMISTSGSRLLPDDAVESLIAELLPLAHILTPNLPEALLISGAKEPESVSDFVSLAQQIQGLGPTWVLLKGGHLPLTTKRMVSSRDSDRHTVLDILVGPNGTIHEFESSYVKSRNTHGTGCSLASAIASNLASGKDEYEAVRDARWYVEAGIKSSKDLGKGTGPINHFHSMYSLPFAPGRFIDFLLSHPSVRGPWHEYTHHPFVLDMAAGTLPLAQFKAYLIQDYLFLIQFARANALAAYKAQSIEDISRSVDIVRHIFTEVELHINYCAAEFDISKEEIIRQEEHQACTAYTRYVLDIGQSQDWFALQVALLPCLLGYGLIARRLFDDPATKREGNHYWKWIENYVAPDYVEAVDLGRGLSERLATKQSASRVEDLIKIFLHATKMETGFWSIGNLDRESSFGEMS